MSFFHRTRNHRAAFITLLFALGVSLFATTAIQAQTAAAFVVMDSASGHVLRASNADKKLQVGSLTKIATAVVLLDWLEVQKRDVNELVTVPPSALAIEGTNPVGFQPGDQASIRDLLYAALLQSDNIAAQALAEHVGRTLPSDSPKFLPANRFVAQMNALARRLHMANTQFLNPHGLDSNERKPPFSTAADMAKLTRYAMTRPQFRFYVSQKDRRINIQHPGGEQSDYLLQNTNELLGTEGIDGVKTGKTRHAGECVIISAGRAPESHQEAENKYTIIPRRLIVVVLGSDARFPVAANLLRTGWAAYEQWVAAGRPPAPNETL